MQMVPLIAASRRNRYTSKQVESVIRHSGMVPAFRVFADSVEITDAVRERLVSLSVTDEAGHRSDTVEIRIDDQDGGVELSRKGAKLEVSLGYRGKGLVGMGVFVVDELELSSPPDSLTIRGKAADMEWGIF